MTTARLAILGLAFLLATASVARGARVEELPAIPPGAAARLLEESLGDRPSIFWFRPSGAGPATIAPDPSIQFEVPEPGDGEGWFLFTAPMVATKALTDFMLRDAGHSDSAPLRAPPPRVEIVPEPATILLFLLGFLLLVLARRRL